MPNPYLPSLTAELARHGVADWWVDRQRTHPRLYFHHAGRTQFYVMPSTPSDRRGLDNALADLRRIMGVRRIVVHSTRAPTRRNQTEAAVALTLTVRPDPLAALAALAQEMRHGGWQAGVRSFLAGAGLAGTESETVRAGWWAAHEAGGAPCP